MHLTFRVLLKKNYKSVVCKALWHAVLHVLSTAHEEEKIPHLAEKETCARILSVSSRSHLDLNLTLKDYYFQLGVYFQSGLYPVAEVVCVLLFNLQPPFWRGVLDCGSLVQSMNPRFLPSTQAPNFLPLHTSSSLIPGHSLMTPQMGNTIRHGKEILPHIILLWRYHCGSV